MERMLELLLCIGLPLGLAVPLGFYIEKVMAGRPVFLTRLLGPVERGIYSLLGIDADEDMSWKKYLAAVLCLSAFGALLLFALLLLQGLLPLNPENRPGLDWTLALNGAVSFVTNTNWQAYQGEHLSYLVQALGLTVQNFLSAGTGMAVAFALFRGFVRREAKAIGSFWVDLTRGIVYVLLPLSLVLAVALGSQGVVQSFSAYQQVPLAESQVLEDGSVVTREIVPLGPAASQIAIKQLGTNGGGFFGANSAHPLENPTPFSNLLELMSILLLPAALCFSFGRAVADLRQGRAIFIAMLLALLLGLGVILASEQAGTAVLAQSGQVELAATADQAGGNMEGKETRFGIVSSSIWGEFTTAASSGSTNSSLDSFTPLSGLVLLLNMQLGEVIFGGVGSGLYGMLAFAVLTVFIAGLMVGRTPEYLGKKIEPYEMKMAVLVCLAGPVTILAGSAIAACWPGAAGSLANSGAHGFSELLYAYSSCGANNGSAFGGLAADQGFFNVSLALVMAISRFVPIAAVLAIAGHMAGKKHMAVTEGTLRTDNGVFIGLLLLVVLLVGALSFFPALALGPVAEFLQAA